MLGTLYIMRARWQEVLLIVGLQAAGQFAFMQVTRGANSGTTGVAEIAPFAVLLAVTFWVVSKMLAIGFARTSFTDGPVHYEPWTLLKIGYHYFWRIVGFELLIGLIVASIMVGFYVIAMMAGAGAEAMSKGQLNVYMPYCAAAAMLLVAKPMLFGPAAIMVTDCGVFGALGWLSWLKLRAAKKLLAAYILWLAVVLAPSLIVQHGGEVFIANYVTMAVFSIIAGLLTLIIYVMAVKAVGVVYIQTHHRENGFGEEPQTDTSKNQGGGN